MVQRGKRVGKRLLVLVLEKYATVYSQDLVEIKALNSTAGQQSLVNGSS
jgi:hypothetical protein